MGYSRKESNIKQGGWGYRIYGEIEEGIEGRAYRNSMGSCHGPWFSILEFSRGVIQVSRKVYPHPPLLGVFLE